jgi:hypothetical protein
MTTAAPRRPTGAKNPPEKPKKKRHGLTAVQRLLLEPTWEEPLIDEDTPPDISAPNSDANRHPEGTTE